MLEQTSISEHRVQGAKLVLALYSVSRSCSQFRTQDALEALQLLELEGVQHRHEREGELLGGRWRGRKG